MEDAGLDDFFAKKDKSKKKNKTKFTTSTSDILTKQGETEKKKTSKSKKKTEKEKSGTNETSSSKKIEVEEEWVDYEEETEKDYSGLRIQNLQIIPGQEAEDGQDRDKDGGSDVEIGDGEKREGIQGPWKGNAASVTTKAPVPEPEPPKVKEEPAPPKTTGKYVPPSMRRAMMEGGGGSTGGGMGSYSRGRKKVAPNLTSDFDFPSLGGASADAHESDYTNQPFETVKGSGGRQMEDPRTHRQKVELGNKFNALDADDS